MSFRRRQTSPFGNPILIGALTVLVTIVAVTLAYNANNGLPFVPRYNLHLQIADASEVTKNAEVHMGGALIGAVTSVVPARDSAGTPIAVMNLSLDKNVEPLPVDSTFDVRLKSSIGLKYVQVTKGTSSQTYANGATVPLSQSGSEVDLDQFLSMFDAPTRLGVAASTIGFSDALAGRGAGINDAIGAFVPLVTDLGPVARNLASKKTNLGGFFRGLESFSAALVPVARTQADLYGNLDTTFTALASVAVPFLQQWISETPPTFSTVIADSPHIQAFLNDTAGLFKALRPGFATLPQSAPVLADAFAAGARNLPGTTTLDAQLLSLAQHLESYGQNPAVNAGLDRLTLTASSLRSPLAFLTPVQSSCNYVTLFLRNIASSLSDDVITGTALRFNLVVIADTPGSEGVPSQRPHTTPQAQTGQFIGPIHVNPYPNTDSPGQTPECAAGNERYSGKAARIGNPPGNVGLKTETTTRPKT
jgi:ABC-type transporter Mla subunit MlaD